LLLLHYTKCMSLMTANILQIIRFVIPVVFNKIIRVELIF